MSPGSLELADTAARACLARAHRTADELDLLINAGVYHDRILSEPAFAALDPGGHRREPEPASRRESRDVLLRRLQRGVWPADGHSAGRRHARLGDGQARHGGRQRHEPGAGRLARVQLSRGRRRGAVERGRLPRRLHGLSVRHVPRVRGAVPELRELAGGRRARPRPSRPQPPHRRDRRVLRRPGARLRRGDRPRADGGAGASTSARSTCSSPPRRSRASPTPWRRASACPPSGSLRRRTGSPVRTRPRRHSRSSPCDWRRRVRRCSSPRGRGSPSPRRSTGPDPRVRRQRTDIATVARLQALLAPPERGEPRIAPARRGS